MAMSTVSHPRSYAVRPSLVMPWSLYAVCLPFLFFFATSLICKAARQWLAFYVRKSAIFMMGQVLRVMTYWGEGTA